MNAFCTLEQIFFKKSGSTRNFTGRRWTSWFGESSDKFCPICSSPCLSASITRHLIKYFPFGVLLASSFLVIYCHRFLFSIFLPFESIDFDIEEVWNVFRYRRQPVKSRVCCTGIQLYMVIIYVYLCILRHLLWIQNCKHKSKNREGFCKFRSGMCLVDHIHQHLNKEIILNQISIPHTSACSRILLSSP